MDSLFFLWYANLYFNRKHFMVQQMHLQTQQTTIVEKISFYILKANILQ